MPGQNYPQRKSPRLQGYDYAEQGAYFITICTFERVHLFGRIENALMTSNRIGLIAADCWFQLPDHFPHIKLDAFVVMPNHVHGIVVLHKPVASIQLGKIINVYKGAVTRQVNLEQREPVKVWQGRYHDHIIRNERSLNQIREYVYANPERWQQDKFYSE